MTDLQPPVAARRPAERTFHGDTVVDDYGWLANRDDRSVIDYLNAENAYTEAVMAPLADLRETLFTEVRTRTLETDLSLPARRHGYWYYSRTEAGKQYSIHCRVVATPGDDVPPTTDGGPLPGEEILLDENALAEGHEFFQLGVYEGSSDHRWLAYSTDYAGDERYNLRFLDLVTGETRPDEIVAVGEGGCWSLDASVFFYVRVDDAWRPHQIWRHVMGTPPADDVMIYEETDERFFAWVDLTRSERYILLGASSKTTGEVWYLPSDTPLAAPRVITPRRDGVEYSATHHNEHFVIVHNDGARDHEVATTPVDNPGEWTTLIPHQPGVRVTDVDSFSGHLVVSLRRDGLTGLRVLPDAGEPYDIAFPEPIYRVDSDINMEYDATSFRLSYMSMVTPGSIYECDIPTGKLTLRKQKPVLPAPDGRPYHPEDYEQHREWAVAPDGTRVPISVMCRRDTPRDGSAPLLLYGYGSYEHSIDPYFSVARLSLVDRGVVFAIAHIRGGGEMGRHWYDQGKMMAKKNTFTDFVACARHLVSAGWTSTGRLVSRGGSAGGLLVGAALEMDPDAFGGVVASVPFVDALTSVLDPSLPLTVTEWEEWGDPLHDPEAYAYIKSYSPYENVQARPYPPILVLGSLNDTRVSYAEPTKWTAKIRALSPSTEILLKTEMGAGHGGPSGRYDLWKEESFINAWILRHVGLV
ncbi:MAG TPA: S9 family peptidase [Micromonosporaceae bacterium]|nr:S9 family peptidase [Micromonosporaceae bacterium]